MRNIFFLAFSLYSLQSFGQFTDTSYKRIVNKIDDLRSENDKYLVKINELNGFLQFSYKQVSTSEKERERLNRIVKRQTEEILSLTSKLRKNRTTINQMLEEIFFLQENNSEYKDIIDTLRMDSMNVHLQLDSTTTMVKDLIRELEESKFATEAQRSENQALTNTIEDMLDIRKNIYFISISTMKYQGYEVSIERGNLTKLSNLYTGGKISYSGFADNNINSLVEVVSVNALIKYTLFGSSFRFRSIDTEVPLIERLIYFASLDFGWSQPVRRINIPGYSGGINWHLSGGIAFPFVNSINPYLAFGVKREALNFQADGQITGAGSSYLRYLTVGVNF